MIEESCIIRCDHPGCDEDSGTWDSTIRSLELRLMDDGWIKSKRILYYCPLHADEHR
jgi:hypothetical protein